MDILNTIISVIILVILLLLILFSALTFKIFTGKSVGKHNYPPVIGTVFGMIFYFNRLYDYQVGMAKKHKTWRLLALDQSVIYTTDPRNIEHVLKTNFHKYSKGEYNQDIVKDLFGQGIFVVDGDKWKWQRKLASHEFSRRVLRDFSCSVFRKNSVELVRKILEFSKQNQVLDIQDGRSAGSDDILPDGFKVKKGDGVYYMAYAMGRMPYIWGDDAEEFKPERWLNNGIFQPESPFKFIAFNAGPRICLGKDFAYRQMKIVAAALVHFFRFKLSDETKHVIHIEPCLLFKSVEVLIFKHFQDQAC